MASLNVGGLKRGRWDCSVYSWTQMKMVYIYYSAGFVAVKEGLDLLADPGG